MAGSTPLVLAATLLVVGPPLTDDVVRAEVERLLPAVAAARRLDPPRAIPVRPAGREAIAADLGAAVAAGTATNSLEAEARILKILGLVPEAAEYQKLVLDGAIAAPVPYYDRTTRRLVVPDFLPLEKQRPLLVHEIAHALADHRFGLGRFLGPGPGGRTPEGDERRARLALVEGDAGLTALTHADPRESFLGPRALAQLGEELRATATGIGSPSSPNWLAELARFTHADGLLFVARVRARRPWRAVDALWSDPPISSEQVLHPDKYEACEAPVRVGEELLPSLPGFGRPKATDVLGEMVIRAWLARAAPREAAERGAAGWGGDRAGVYLAAATDGGDPGPALAWLTIWDDPAEAEELLRVASVTAVRMARRDEAVAAFFGPADLGPTALEEMLAAWQRQKVKPGRGGRGSRPPRAAQPGCPRRDRAEGSR